MDRRKVIDQAISTLQLTEELDWDKLLWIPGEKKFFLPSIQLETITWLGFDPVFRGRSLTIEMLEEVSQRVFQSLYLGSWDNPPADPSQAQLRGYDRYCECVPGRTQFITSNREIRVPMELGRVTELSESVRQRTIRQGILYDRHERMLID